ncbi:bifunctional helix-turn-helix transcriptional regulator/GNAT family N-acetyltransferase [Dactylosporangium matsuzakiense]|uniref:Transcriptional regulator, MarR family protein n=1 Tax=Dactylosporangium matsuzakiense TaxID=53360 RepID=A0A9W6KSX4_9ACTN|nr:MarR family winged helix-turn-helix transcriptional regulator [Dactylosporangium matsuzakiense]UWZ41467.1 winged helix-turn-helix transcriptional regulator [Dactylosporangium matsuzakiense]GLL07028.1 putative transcriptional regulator, MarR family protein [Dactylosporangium matsuzakiense]
MEAAAVEQVRRFNRTVTQRIGALEDEYMARERSLGLARVLWEVGADGADVRQLRERLGLDSGYLSRLLRTLEADGLVVVAAGRGDGRVRTVRLTPAGLGERRELETRSDELAASILRPLSERQRARLVEAMADVERLLTTSMVAVAPLDPRHPHARHCIRAYYEELAGRFPGGFDPGRSISAADDELTPPSGVLLVATLHGEPVGCGALKFHAGAPAEVKRMWVAPTTRGLGLGRRLLAELEAVATAAGTTVLRLETNNTLHEALQLYRSAGYEEVDPFNAEPYAHHWFEKRVSPPPRPPGEPAGGGDAVG